MKIVFQGDSITDAGRDRSDAHNLAGYTTYIAEALGEKDEYFNFGISGDRAKDVLARFDADFAVCGSADVFTLLIGINDVWRNHDSNLYTSPEEYYQNVKQILIKVKERNPDCKIVLLEPFLLPAPDKVHWVSEVAVLQHKLRLLAKEYADAYIPFDGIFAKEYAQEDWQEFSLDGVHPTDKGNRLMAMYIAAELSLMLEEE